MSRVLQGTLEAYWEQGWEGRFECAFAADDEVATTGPRVLRNGDRLTVYGEDGAVLWRGEISLMSPGWFARRRWTGSMWAESHPRGVPYERWMAWFTQVPPLRAELEEPS